MSPLPEYKKAGHQTVYAQVPDAIKAHLEDIAYHLDMNEREAIMEIIEAYVRDKKVKPRPSR